MFSAVSIASYIVGALQKQVLCFAWLLEGFVLMACKKKMLCQVSKPRELSSIWRKRHFNYTIFLMPLHVHVESDSCDRSRLGILSCKNRLEYLPFLCFDLKEKFFDAIWRPHFPSGDRENISVASWCLPNKSYLGPCVA